MANILHLQRWLLVKNTNSGGNNKHYSSLKIPALANVLYLQIWLLVKNTNSGVKVYYAYSDYLGSILTLTDNTGAIAAKQNFDAWGRYRNPDDWTYNNVPGQPKWLYRGFTGHEHLAQFALINMNGRMYDPVSGRMLSPDNNVPLPWNTQGYNRYSYANNNPLVYVDPDGNFFWLAIPIFAGVNLFADLVRNDFRMDIGQIGLSLVKGAVQGTMAGLTGGVSTAGQALVSSVGSQLPGINIPIGDNASFSLSPAVMFGSTGFSIGVNAGFSINTAFGSIGTSYGFGFSQSNITGISGEYRRFGYGASLGGRDLNLQVGSSNFFGGGTSQETGYVGVGGKDWSVINENDYMFGIGNSDAGDRYRTAGFRASYKDFSIGLNLFTGAPDVDENGVRMKTQISPGRYQYIESGPKYRAGMLYGGYGNYRIGVNGEPVRNYFQNHLIHKDGYKYPIFEVLNTRLYPYFSYQSLNPFTTW